MQNPPKPSPPSSQADFEKSSRIPEPKRIELEFGKLSTSARIRYKLLLERQSIVKAEMVEDFERQKPALIELYTREALDKSVREIHPVLKPKHLHSDDRATQRANAECDAIAKVDQLQRVGLQEMDRSFLSDQERLLAEEKSKAIRQTFNLKSNEGLSIRFNHENGRGR